MEIVISIRCDRGMSGWDPEKAIVGSTNSVWYEGGPRP